MTASADVDDRETTRHWGRWLGWGTLALLLLLLAAHALWGLSAERRLAFEGARLRPTGEPMDFDAVRNRDVPDDQNASLDYQAASRHINERTAAWDKWDMAEEGAFELPLTADEATT